MSQADTLFGFPVVDIDDPRLYEAKFGLSYICPFDKLAAISITNQDYEHAQWIGDASLPVNFSYQMLSCIERLPWKLREVLDESYRETKYFVRDEAVTL